MGQFLFFAVIILFSILESVAKKKKAQAEAERLEAAGGVESGAEESGPRPPTSERTVRSSEAMIPSELWEEIAGLAEGRGAGAPSRLPPQPQPRAEVPVPPRRPADARPRRVEAPTRVYESPAPEAGTGTGRTASVVPAPAPTHAVHLSHVGFGTDPSTRAPSEQDGLDPLQRHLSGDVKRVRALLAGSGGIHALRQAVLLQEILEPPLALRDERPATSRPEPSS